jgi:parvulin-like peptidyl-prolyl isomerase
VSKEQGLTQEHPLSAGPADDANTEPAAGSPDAQPPAAAAIETGDGTEANLLEDGAYADDDLYEDTEQGFVHIRTSVFAVGATIASLLILALLAGNVYQIIHARSGGAVATVNGAPITQAEFLRAAGQQDQALQSLIDQKLILQEAKKENVTIPDSEVNSEVGTIKQQLGTDKDFATALQRANLTEPQLREQIRTQKLAQKMGAKSVTISDDEAQSFYTQNKAQYGTQTFDQAKDQVKTQLLQSKQNEAIQTWIADLRSKAKIVINIPA